MEFSKEKLLNLLEELHTAIENDAIPESTQKHLWETLTFDSSDPYYKTMITYLFTGWWIHTQEK